MSDQLTLDAMGGIDWEHPRLEQLEQAALDHVRGADVRLWNVERVGMCVLVQVGRRLAWMKPCMQRTADDNLEWVVLFQAFGSVVHKELRSDEELESALASVFEVS